jgi:hypothetical protein
MASSLEVHSVDLLRDPLVHRGTAFTAAERVRFGLAGRLPRGSKASRSKSHALSGPFAPRAILWNATRIYRRFRMRTKRSFFAPSPRICTNSYR